MTPAELAEELLCSGALPPGKHALWVVPQRCNPHLVLTYQHERPAARRRRRFVCAGMVTVPDEAPDQVQLDALAFQIDMALQCPELAARGL